MPLITLDNEQKMIQSEVRKFATSSLEPISSEIDKNAVISDDIFKKLNDLGLLYPIIPSQYSGAGMNATSLCIIIEEISKSLASLGAILVVNNSVCAFLIDQWAGDGQKKKYFNLMNSGKIMGYVMEPQVDPEGTDASIDSAGAVTGKRNFALNAMYADSMLVPFTGKESMAAVIINKKDKGVKLSKIDLLGLNAAGIMSAEFMGLSVSPEARIKPSGAKSTSHLSAFTQLGFSAVLLGISQAGLDAAVKYSKERKQFGRAICEFYMVQEMLVNMKVRIEAGRNLVYDAAFKYDHKEDFTLASMLCFIHACDTAVYCGLNAIQVHGGYGYTKDYPVERYLRDAKTVQNIAGVGYTVKEQVARDLLGKS
jgi:alkylation response protein AidB-like acyl-CoA dehydrogenase